MRVPPFSLKVVHIIKKLLLRSTKIISDGVTVIWSQDLRWRTVDDAAILHIETADLGQVTVISAIVCQKLRHLRHWFRCVHCKFRSSAIECLVPHPERIDVATIFVTHALVAFTLVIITAIGPFASQLAGLLIHRAWMWSICGCHAVSFPNVHLRTTSAIMADPHVVSFVLGVRSPIDGVGFATNEFDVVRTLSIAIPRAILGASLIVAKALPALLIHLDEVHSTIHATFKVGYIDVHGKLPVLQIEKFVFVVTVHQIQAGANIHAILMFCYKVQLYTTINLCDAVCTSIFLFCNPFKGTILATRNRISAYC